MNTIKSIFSIANHDGVLVLKEYKEEAFNRVKDGAIGRWSASDFMINATYKIEDGVLILTGERVTMDFLASGEWDDKHFDTTGYDLNKLREMYHIGDTHIRLEPKKWWSLFGKTKTVIDRGNYLRKKGFDVTYKTTLYKIIE